MKRGPPEGLAILDLEFHARRQSTLGEVAEHVEVTVGDAHQDRRFARLEVCERKCLLSRRQPQVLVGNRIPVRVVLRIPERGGDQRLELLGDVMLEHLGPRVYAIPRHPERVREVRFEQAVAAEHSERHMLGASVRRAPW